MSRARAARACEAMKALGISSKVVKPVLKNLLQLYDHNWELIEEENYRVLADAIFELEDAKEEGAMKTTSEKIDRAEDDLSPPSTRQRSRQETDQSFPLACNSGIVIGETSSKRRKMDDAISPQITCSQEQMGPNSSQAFDREKATGPVLTPLIIKGKGPVVVSQTCSKEKRNGPNPLQASIGGKRSEPILPQRAPNAVCLKEPKVEPGIDHLPNVAEPTGDHSNALIKPKSEPFMGDFPQLEVPIAVVHPRRSCTTINEDQTSREGPFRSNSSGQTDTSEAFASQDVAARDEERGVQRTTNCNAANLKLVSISEASSANFEIASSASGEVKLSLTCSSDRSGLHTPNIEEVLKLVEDKCLRSYKIIEPSFSIVKAMQEICQCFLELSSDSTDSNGERHVNPIPTLDALKKTDLQDAMDARCDPLQGNFNHLGSSSKGSSDSHHSCEVINNQVPGLLGSNGMDGFSRCTQPNGETSKRSEDEEDLKNKVECSQSPDSDSLVLVQQRQFSFGDVKPLHDVNDIAKSEEKVRISLVNEVNGEQYPPSFFYIAQNIVYQNAYVNFSLARIGDEDCCSDCFGDCLSSSIPCACARETGGAYAYTLDGLLKGEFLDECISMNRDPKKHCHLYCKDCPLERSRNADQPDQCKGHLVRKFIKECWSKCGCSKQCGNRIVQRGITCNLQVFFTSEGKGWGLRTLEELPKGTFVCEYVGEVLTNTELHNRNMQRTWNAKHHYPVLLDADWGSGVLKDEEALCLDATFYGNVSRFINHRCFDSNLVEVPVEIESPDHHYYHLAFFTRRKVEALDELTWDYGIDFDDGSHPVKAFNCRCGSKFCRDMQRSSRMKSKPTALVLR